MSRFTPFAALAQRLLFALGLAAAVGLAAAPARAQQLPEGYTTDIQDAAGETEPSQARVTMGPQAAPYPGAQPVQDVVVEDEEAVPADDYYEDTDPSAITEFQPVLSPYGTWMEDPTYGTVWVPSAVVVGADFAPYQTAGHWAMTDEGEWLWVSDYEWGYVPFHYGRWVWISGTGWGWIPGRVYAPAWVVWRVSDYGYVGWAPMPPAYYWSGGVALSLWVVPPAAYVFCPTTHVFHHHVHTYVVRDRTVVGRIARHSHSYRPARPSGATSGGSHAHKGGHGGVGSRPGFYRPASPSLAEAGVPPSAAPKAYVKPDRRSLAFARKSTTPLARKLTPGARGLQAAPGARPGRIQDPWAAGGRTPGRGGVLRAPDAPGRRPSPDAAGRMPLPRDGGRAVPRGPTPQPHVGPAPADRPHVGPAPVPRPHVGPAPADRPDVAPAPRTERPRAAPAPQAPAPQAAPTPAPTPRVRPQSSRKAPSASPAPAPAPKRGTMRPSPRR